MLRTFRAPGRVNLIGDHVDYVGGMVCPASIDLECRVRVLTTEGDQLRVRSVDLDEEGVWDVHSIHKQEPTGTWMDYVVGVARELDHRGIALFPAHMEIASTVPIGAGLSSSASLEISIALALCDIAGETIPRPELVEICVAAERNFVGVQCGIMDQFVSVYGADGCALLLDCHTKKYQLIELPSAMQIVVVDSMVRHSLGSSAYNERREQCSKAEGLLGKPLHELAVNDVSSLVKVLPAPLKQRVRHVVTENERVQHFAEACWHHDFKKMGACMKESHESLRDDYEVSCQELDFLVDLAQQQHATIGARMTGGGFGGCTVNLIEPGSLESWSAAITKVYADQFSITPEVYVVKPSQGAGICDLEA